MKELSIQKLALAFIENKSEKNFAALMNRLRPGLTSYVYNFLHDVDASKETVNQVFINIWEKIHQYDTKYNFSTWAYAIAKNEALGALRQSKKYVSRDSIGENQTRLLAASTPVFNMDIEVIGPRETEIVDPLHDKVHEEIFNLREPYKTVMIEREIKKNNLQVISDNLDWNLSTVKTRLRKARIDIAENIRTKHPLLMKVYDERIV